MSNLRWSIVCVLAAVLLAAGCGSDTNGGGSNNGGSHDASVDTADAGADVADVGADATDVGSDATAPSCDQFPAPEVAGTTQTDALAQSPAHCGQPSYTWLTNADLGAITQTGIKKDFTANFLKGVAQSQNITLPRNIAHDTHVVQFGYTTQDRGQTIEASALLAYPTDRQPTDGPQDVLLLLHGTTGFTDECAPSKDLASQGLAALLASFGYVVVAPDYIGLKGLGDPTGFIHPYLVGQATAIASLDAVRAAAHLPADERGGWCLKPRVVVVGGSQGGHAALWVDRLAPYYARELKLAGVVATVPPADMVGQMERALTSVVKATGNTVAFLGATAGWYGYADQLDQVFQSPYDTEVPQTLAGGCDFSALDTNPSSTSDIFKQPLIDAAQNGTLASVDPWGCITAENGLTTTTVDRIPPQSDSYGVLFVLGENDELVHTPIERTSFQTLCDQGMKMQFLECAGAHHGETTFLALSEILDFVDARLAGQPFDSQTICQLSDPVQCQGAQ